MSLTAWVLIGLLAGLAFGVGISLVEHPALLGVVAVAEPLGTLWVNAIRMTVIPLVVSLLITGVASSNARTVGKIGGRALVWFVGLVLAGAILAAVVAPPLLALAQFDTSAIAPLGSTGGQVQLPPFRDWIVDFIPANPVRAAAEGAMLPLIVFTAIVALAVTRLEPSRREPLVGFFDAMAHAMFVIVKWILAVAPIGVFCLVLPLAARTGIDLVGAVGHFLLVACVLVMVSLIALYPIAVFVGGIPLSKFVRACAPAQAVGFSTRSSLASLPAMLDAAERELALPPQVTGVALPVAVSVFKYASPVARITGTLFVAQLYGIDLSIFEIAAISGAIALLSFYSPGVPSGGLFIMTPIYMAFQLPVEGIGLLIALDLIPDMFITTANVTADMTVAAVVGKTEG